MQETCKVLHVISYYDFTRAPPSATGATTLGVELDPIALRAGRDRAVLGVGQELHTIEASHFLSVGQASHALIPDLALKV